MNRLLAPDRPDWRWARVADLSQYSTTAALARLQHEDELTRQAYDFRRALDRGLVRGEFEAFDAAYQIFMNRPELRIHVEGLLIAGADNETVAHDAFSDEEVVEIYHELFFWVRPGLDRSAWLNSTVFGGMPHINANLHDIHGTSLRLARKIGVDAFRQLVGAGLSSETSVQQLRSMVNEVLLTQVAMMSFSAGTSRELPEWVGRLMDQKDAGSGSGNPELDKAVDAFFEGFSVSVADPTEERNLSLPAQEERVNIEACEVIEND